MARRRPIRAVASHTGDAAAWPGGYANTGVHVGDVYLSNGPPRSRYQELVRRIAPPELMGREEELAELAAFCQEAGGYRWWRAPAWAGKSALMSWFVLHPPLDVRVVSFFVTARLAGQSDRTAFLDSTLEQLATLLDRPLPAFLADANREAHFLGMLADAADACAERGERLLLLVDGLDEDRGVTGADFHSIAAALPLVLPRTAVVVVSSRPNPPVPDDVPDHHPLRDPTIVRPLARSLQATVVAVDMRRELDRLLTGSPVDQDLLGLLVASRGGLSAADLAELVSDPDWPVWRVEEYLRTVAGRSFTPLPGPERSFMLGHEELAVTAISRIGPKRLGRYRKRLHSWANSYRDLGWPGGTPGYLLGGYHRMLTAEDDLPRMVRVASDRARHDRMADTIGGNRTAIAEISATQHALLSSDPDLSTLALLNVHLHVLADRDWHIPVELPAVWAALGDADRARSLARSITSHDDRVKTLLAIADVLPASDPCSVELVTEAEMEVGLLDDLKERGRVTAFVASWMADKGWLTRAIELLRPVIDYVNSDLELMEIMWAVIRSGDLSQAESVIDLASGAGRSLRRRFRWLNDDYRIDLANQCRIALVRVVARRGTSRGQRHWLARSNTRTPGSEPGRM